MVDALDTDKIASWKDHDPRLHTTHFLLDGQPYPGATHPMRSLRGIIHYSGVSHTAESRRLQFSLRAVIIPQDFAYLDRQERVPRNALDGMFERQAVEQDIYNTTGERVAVRTVMRERQSPFNGERGKPQRESSIVTTRLFNSKQQQVIDRMNGVSSAAAPSTSDPPLPPTPQSATAQLPPETPERSGLVANDDTSLDMALQNLADTAAQQPPPQLVLFEGLQLPFFSMQPTTLPSPPSSYEPFAGTVQSSKPPKKRTVKPYSGKKPTVAEYSLQLKILPMLGGRSMKERSKLDDGKSASLHALTMV